MNKMMDTRLNLISLLKFFFILVRFNISGFLIIFLVFFLPDQLISFIITDIIKINEGILKMNFAVIPILFISFGWSEIYSLVKNRIDSDEKYKMFKYIKQNWYKLFITGFIMSAMIFIINLFKELSVSDKNLRSMLGVATLAFAFLFIFIFLIVCEYGIWGFSAFKKSAVITLNNFGTIAITMISYAVIYIITVLVLRLIGIDQNINIFLFNFIIRILSYFYFIFMTLLFFNITKFPK